MGTAALVAVTSPRIETAEVLATAATNRLHRLEQLWSRFLPDSEISRLNTARGRPVAVTRETELLVRRSVDAWHETDGRFDPTVLPSLVAAGYDRDFREVAAAPGPVHETAAAPGCADVRIRHREVQLPPGVMIDPGGIGKGLAADLTVDLLMTAGADGACVNVGGDLRVAGRPDGPPDWSVLVQHPLHPDRDLGTVTIRDEALASTWRTRRTWGDGPARRHHVIDPSTGRSTDNGLAGVTVIDAEAWHAEAVATALFVAGADAAPDLARERGLSALLVRDDGAVRGTGRLAPLVAASRSDR